MRSSSIGFDDVNVAEPASVDERPYVESLEFAVQARIKGGREYEPLIDVNGLPCWPSRPDFDQLIGGKKMAREGRDFESDWDSGEVQSRVLRVGDDFDFVVLGIGIGAVPRVCAEIINRDERWQAMIENVKTVETQSFQVWLREDMGALGWAGPPVTISGYVHPFNTWADMQQLIPAEDWSEAPKAIAYFCNALPPDASLDRADAELYA